MQPKFTAHPKSAPGDFYVEKGQCLACGVPQVVAPDLVGWADYNASKQTSQRISVRDESQARLSEWFILIKSYARSGDVKILVPAVPAADFKNCCLRTGHYDGSLRDHYQR